MRTFFTAALGLAIVASPAAAQNWHSNSHGDRHDNGHSNRSDRHDDDRRQWKNYDYNRPDPRNGNRYDAAHYYHGDNRGYRTTRLGRNDRVYRGSDNRYYCRRTDGTTGLIIGGLAGGLLGNVLTSGGSQTLGTLLGAGGGALLGRSVDRGNVICR